MVVFEPFVVHDKFENSSRFSRAVAGSICCAIDVEEIVDMRVVKSTNAQGAREG